MSIALLLISNCKSYSQVMLDPIAPSPYKIEYKSNVVLPDSLGGNKYNGLALVQGRINHNLKIEDIKIMKLQLVAKEGDTFIDYYFGQDSLSLKGVYPMKVSAYLPFFENLAKKVIVKKQEGVSTKNMNQVTLVVRFN